MEGKIKSFSPGLQEGHIYYQQDKATCRRLLGSALLGHRLTLYTNIIRGNRSKEGKKFAGLNRHIPCVCLCVLVLT